MYAYETRGEGDLGQTLFAVDGVYNGYAIGKKYMNVQVEMWKEDIARGILLRSELEAEYPAWFLDKFIRVEQGRPLTLDQVVEAYRRST